MSRIQARRPYGFYTIYAPPEHKDKTVHATKQDAESKKKLTSTAKQPKPPIDARNIAIVGAGLVTSGPDRLYRPPDRPWDRSN